MNRLAIAFLRQLTFWQGHRLRRCFEHATKNYVATQTRVLLQKLHRAQRSQFGKRYAFSLIRTIEDFQKRVPLHTHEDLQMDLMRVQRGEVSALLHPREKIHMFALSSGTTDVPKAIPVTSDFLRQYRRGSLLWGLFAALDHPEFLEGKIVPLVSPACETRSLSGIPCGAISGLIAQTQKYIARRLYPVPAFVYQMSDVEARDYLILRFALTEDVRLVTSANPSSLVRLAKAGSRRQESLLRDIHDGTTVPPFQHFKFSPNPTTARKLEALAAHSPGFIPKAYWPNLALLACWKGGTLSAYLPLVQELYGMDVPIRDLGLLASEGRMTIPIEDKGCGGILDIQSHFFEFLPEEEEFHPQARTLLGHELKGGHSYYIILTTSSGLYRYHIHDVVQVEDYFHQTPILKFLNKGRYFSSITGEKISEYQVVQAVQRSSLEQQLKVERFLLAPQWADPPHYLLLVEETHHVDKSRWNHFVEEVERHLLEMNAEYCSKRKSQRLNPVQLRTVKAGFFHTWDQKELERRSGRHEQFKPRFLLNNLSYFKEFDMIKFL